jgi:alanine racemase
MPTRPCWVEISTRALENNFRNLRAIAPPHVELMAIVKADAYGHSLALCAPAAVRAEARWLGVTSVEEGAKARTLCPDPRIVIMGGIFPGQGSEVVRASLTPVVWTLEQLDELSAAAQADGLNEEALSIWLEIDTGMSRQGVDIWQLPVVLARIAADPVFRLESVTTHLYASDERDGRASDSQLARLQEAFACIRSFPAESVRHPEWISVGASAALLGNDLQAVLRAGFSPTPIPLMRPGLALYGLVPRFVPMLGADSETADAPELQPVLAWKTRVVSLREVPPGAEIGYNGTFAATEPMRLALIAAGYADGLDRRLGNRFSLLVRGQRAPLVGRISMDQAVLDVTEISGVEPGDEVVILGSQDAETISAFDHADACGTIPWEVFTRIAQRVTRVAV